MPAAFRLSIAANVALMGIVAVLLWRERAAHRPAFEPAAKGAAVEEKEAAFGAESRPTSTGTGLNPATMAQLEQMGLSRDVLIDALLGDFHRRWDQRFAALEKQYAPKPVPEREYVALARQRDVAQIRELTETLGEEGYQAWDKARTLRLLNSAGLPVTDEEAGRAYRLWKEFDLQHKELQMAMEDGVADMADAATLQAQAHAALERELEQLFGAVRLRRMRGLIEPVAEVRRRYGDLNPTSEQANAVLRIEEEHRAREADLARRLGENQGEIVAPAVELEAMNRARDESLRQIFGAEAYDHTQRQSDPVYQKLRQFAGAWEIAEPEMESVYQALRSFHEQTERARAAAAMSEAAGRDVNWREINAAAERVRQQTEAGLQNLLGGQRLTRLKQNGLLMVR